VRIDLFHADGHRTGHVILDRGSGHVDFYDEGSRWTGYGAGDLASGEVRRFDADGRPRESTNCRSRLMATGERHREYSGPP